MSFAATVPADPGYHLQGWLVDQGLPHNVVNRVVQDHRGFLWVATLGGLARFDGREFRDYPLPELPPSASLNIRDLAVENEATLVMLPATGGIWRLRDGVYSLHPASADVADKTLLSLLVAPDGVLWVGTNASTVMRWKDGHMITLGPNEGLTGRPGTRIFFAQDAVGRTWIANGEFVGWYANGKLTRLPIDTHGAAAIALARSGGIWIATPDQLLKWENEKLEAICSRTEWISPVASVQQLYEDRGGVLWIGTRRLGLFRIVDGKPIAEATEHFQISAITEDNDANLWVSMDGGGINRLRRKTFALLDSADGLQDNISTSVCEDATGAIWCADRAGGAVRMQEGVAKTFDRTPEGGSLYASNISPDREGNIWIGAVSGLYRLKADASGPLQKMEPAISPVRLLYCSSKNEMWTAWGYDRGERYKFGYFRKGAYQAFSAREGFAGQHIVAVAEAPDGVIWVGADDGQLLEFRDGKFIERVARDDPKTGRIHTILVDQKGGLWIGTERGLILREGDKLYRFTRADGLPDDFITQALEDSRGRLWLCTRRGFCSLATAELRDLAAGRISRVTGTTFGSEEGLPGISAPTGGQPMSWKARDGRLWFVTSRGIVGFDPMASLAVHPSPTVYIDQVLLDGESVSAAKLKLPPGSHRIEFNFVALNYSAPEKVRMRHQLVGFDQDWVETGAERSAAYPHLPPGKYALQVIAANQDGRWSPAAATLSFIVTPAWWQTWWWRTGALLIFTAAVALLARFFFLRRLKRQLDRLEQEHALEKERARIARDLHDDLGGSLTQIGMLADRLNRQADSSPLRLGLKQLAGRTRGLAGELESIVWAVSPKNDTWDRLASFIAQFVQRFFRDTTIACSAEGAESIPALPLAPEAQHHVLAIVKEAMNNVLKHSQATQVTITMSFAAQIFEMRVRDNGIGFDPAAGEHAERNGLTNMRTRADEIGGSLDIVSQRTTGTELTVRIPQTAAAPAKRR